MLYVYICKLTTFFIIFQIFLHFFFHSFLLHQTSLFSSFPINKRMRMINNGDATKLNNTHTTTLRLYCNCISLVFNIHKISVRHHFLSVICLFLTNNGNHTSIFDAFGSCRNTSARAQSQTLPKRQLSF